MATAQKPPEEEILQIGEQLQEKFLREYKDDQDIDVRDYARVQQSLKYVSKFVRQNHGNFNNAYNHLVECLKWRKSFGVNGITFEEIPENMWRMGMAYNHGMDRQGNHIVILNIRLHKKDSKKALLLRRWICFCYETQQRLYPDAKMCMIFDMDGAGLSNMDMDLVRFIINCFKIYFPDLLAYLLIFNMPWVLHAAWKIVQTWLSDSSKIKFCDKEGMAEYIAPDQLLVKFGGNDPWTFDYNSERERIEQEVEQAWANLKMASQLEGGEDTPPSGEETDPPSISSLSGETSKGGSGELEEEETPGRKQVRFSSNLPPTRQSRFGPIDGERVQFHSPNNATLAKGSVAETGFRRRQVSKLMSLQTDPNERRRSLPPRHHSMDAQMYTSERRVSENSNSTAFHYLLISPPQELVFSGKDDSDILCSLSLTNITENTVAYKVKTTAPQRYKVKPNLALIDPKSVAIVQVLLIPGSSGTSIVQDKFLVQAFAFGSSMTIPDQNQLGVFWKTLPEHSIREQRMRCRWVNSLPPPLPRAGHQTGTTSLPPRLTPGERVPGQQATSAVGPDNQEVHALTMKVDRVIASNTDLSKQVKNLQRSNFIILVLLILVIILVYFY